MKGPLSSTTRSHGCGLIASMQYPLPRAPHFLPFAAAAMDTYAPRTIEQFHACTRQRLKSAAAQQKQLQQGKGAAAAAAAGSAAAAAATQKVKAAAAATPAAPVERADGRKNTQLRSTFLQSGVVSAAVGSAYVERQGTKVLCAIYGPRASSKLLSSSTPFSGERGHFAVDAKYAPFACSGARRARRGAQLEADERALQTALSECLSVSIHLESFPKAVLEAFVIVLQDEGSVFASAVAATSLALADAGIMLYDLTTACRAITLDGQLLLDPSGEEEARWAAAVADAADAANDSDAASDAATAATSVTLAYMPSLRQISSITQAGSSGSTAQLVTSLTHLAIAGCEQLNGLMRECLVDSAKQQMTLNGAPAATTARPPA